MNSDKRYQMLLCLPSVPINAAFKPGVTRFEPAESWRLGAMASFQLRDTVEMNAAIRQACTYHVVARSNAREVLAYRRPTGDPRLLGSLSCGFGGHVEAFDWPGDHCPGPERFHRAIRNAVVRENWEELELLISEAKVEIQGVMRDDTDHVGECHLGFLSVSRVTVDRVFRTDEGVGAVDWMQVDDILADPKAEGWTRLALDYLYNGV